MKFLTLLALSFSVVAFAEEGKVKAEMFQEMKTNLLTNLDQRIGNLNSAKSCVSAAADGEALKACREKLKAANKELQQDMKGQREGMRAKKEEFRAKMKEERKKKKQQ